MEGAHARARAVLWRRVPRFMGFRAYQKEASELGGEGATGEQRIIQLDAWIHEH